MKQLFSKALEYAVNGYSVIPLKPGQKLPLLLSWKKYQTKSAEDAEIEAWFSKNPTANIGIITGKISGITVIDIDTKGDTVVPLETFPPTYTVKTPSGGYHLYYQYDSSIQQTANTFPQFPHVDIRNDGGYVVAPPSSTEKGSYTVINNGITAPFPVKLFPSTSKNKESTQLTAKIGLIEGEGRDNAMTSVIGKLIRSYLPKDWDKEVWEAACAINNTYKPPLPLKDMKRIYTSISKAERKRIQGLIPSPIEMTDEQKGRMSRDQRNRLYALTTNDKDIPHPHSANIVRMLSHDPEFKGRIRYDVFRRQIQFLPNVPKAKWMPYTDEIAIDTTIFLQDTYNRFISKTAVHDAFIHVAYANSYDEPTEWLKSLKWDKTPRLEEWLLRTCHIQDDVHAYHRAVGSRWLAGLVSRLIYPGCIFDNALVLSGPQGIGKTSIFRILGADWYREFIGDVGDKDFFLLLAGAAIVDLDEGASLTRVNSMHVKAALSRREDTYRSPYDKVPKTFPRRNVFSMTTNDHEVLRDQTGNRRFWMVKFDTPADFEWLEENRDQLFAEAYHVVTKKLPLPPIPQDDAVERQAEATAIDPWEPAIHEYITEFSDYKYHPENLRITTIDIYKGALKGGEVFTLRDIEAKRIGRILRNMGFDRKRIREKDKLSWVFVASDKLIEKLRLETKDHQGPVPAPTPRQADIW